MATLNRKMRTERASDPVPVTHEGGKAAHIDAVSQLERSVMSCMLWENEFYEDGQSIGKRIAALVSKIDPAEVARIAVQAKKDMRLRHVPLLLVRELMRTSEGRKQAQFVFPQVILRADDVTEFLAMYWKDKKDAPLAKQVKKHLGEAFRKFDEYQLAKYNGGQKEIKLRDALRILRPKPKTEEESALWKKLVKDELATPDTWEVEISKSGDKLTSWTRLVKEGKLGGMAMLRNIRNMREAGVDAKLIHSGIDGILAGRLVPINFIAAANTNPQFEPIIEKKFFECFAGKEKIKGDTIVLVDVSGSMVGAKISKRSEMDRLDVACSLAMIARETFEDVRIFTFANGIQEHPARRGFALKDAIQKVRGGGTELGRALRNMPKHARLIVITDEQSHDEVGDHKGYLINVASNQHGVGYGGNWIHIDGWSDKVIDYIVRHERAQYES